MERIEHETKIVTAVDSFALLLYVLVLTQVPSPPFGVSPEAMMIFGLVFPVLAYLWSWWNHPGAFWYGFALSLAGVTALVVLGLILAFPSLFV